MTHSITSQATDSRLVGIGIVLVAAGFAAIGWAGVQLSASNWWGIVTALIGLGLVDAGRRQLAAARSTLELDDTGVAGLRNPTGVLAWDDVATAVIRNGRLAVVPTDIETYAHSPHPYLLHLQMPKYALVARLDPSVIDDIAALLTSCGFTQRASTDRRRGPRP